MGNMCEVVQDRRSWLDPLISKVAENLGKEFKNARYDLATPGDSFYVSSMLYVNIIATSSDGEGEENAKKKSVGVVVKKPSMNEAVRTFMKMDAQFHNEILFYRRFAKDHEDLPRCFYAEEKPPADSVLVLENVSRRGYRQCKLKCRVPLEYIVAAIREIARFHTKSYVMKERDREKFFDFVWDLWEVRYDLDPENTLMIMINASMARGVDYLRAQGYDKDFCDKVGAKFENAYQTVTLPSVEPEEPLATLCHGDYTLNNVLFKNEGDELRAMLIDFALTKYGSPVIDLATFLCLHCAEELDKDMLDNLLKVYHDSLTQCLKENGIDCAKYSYEALCEDYKRKGLFGYSIASFFLCVSMGKTDATIEEMVEADIQEWAKMMNMEGGDEISKILANLLLRLKEFGCLDHLI